MRTVRSLGRSHPRFADVIAACLRIGRDAVAVDDTAAAVWELGDAMPRRITIATPHAWRSSLRDDVPVTTMERTLADLAHADPDQGAETIHEARRAGRLSDRVWRRATSRYPILTTLDARLQGRS